VIIATAGHVDHGKTSLVRALTGIDTDRLPEEKRRGMSIDLGFAYLPMPGHDPIAFVDVPGHERFVRNMAAGVGGVDLALLVVAADDGPMPQTREHMAILEHLGAPRLLAVLSKIDRVPAQRVAEANLELRYVLDQGNFRGSDVLPVSSVTGEGLEVLRQRLSALADALPSRVTTQRFRMNVDRAFFQAFQYRWNWRSAAGFVVMFRHVMISEHVAKVIATVEMRKDNLTPDEVKKQIASQNQAGALQAKTITEKILDQYKPLAAPADANREGDGAK